MNFVLIELIIIDLNNVPIDSVNDSKGLRYFVNSAECTIPYVNPFSKEVMQHFRPLPINNCSDTEDVVESIFDKNTRRFILHIKEHDYKGDIGCCYKQIIRRVDDNSDDYDFLRCKKFPQNFVVPLDVEGIIVECYTSNYTKLLQQNAFVFVQFKDKTQRGHAGGQNIRKPSILLMGIDSMSPMNFRRNMVKTYEYLAQNNWYEMQGYNKIGDNTYPNLMAVLTGYNKTYVYSKCLPFERDGLDNCPYIWKFFQGLGYRTAYAEDEARLNTFNRQEWVGFQKPPTDYYFRPYLKAFEKHLSHKFHGSTLFHCVGRRHPAEYVYDYIKQLSYQYPDEPVFGLFWTNSFSHNSYDTASAMDHVVLRYLQEFEESGILNTSIVIFFSDHGMRIGILTALKDGFLEERLPMLFIWIPKWFAQQYPQYVKALKVNKNRLTSPYDLHMTLKHLLQLASGVERVRLLGIPSCPRCQSLFHIVPEDRNCLSVGVPEQFCTCFSFEKIDSQEFARNMTESTIEAMNQYLTKRNFTEKCAELSYVSLENAEKRIIRGKEGLGQDLNNQSWLYRLKFHTDPNYSAFQAIVRYHRLNSSVTVDVESISRLNSYKNDSECIADKEAKKYCICRNAIRDIN